MPDSPPPADSIDVTRIMSLFESAWQAGGRPDLAALLPPPDHPDRRALLVELVHVDLERRLKQGQDPLVEEYLVRFPELAEDAAAVRDLLLARLRLKPPTTGGPPRPEAAPRPAATTRSADALKLPRPPAEAGPALPRVSGYEVLAVLGSGAMGIVYKARQLPLNRDVALKMIRDGAHADAEQRLRFLGEAETMARVRHPNVVQIYEVGEHDGSVFLALEYVDGPTLAARGAGQPQPPPWAAGLVEVLARAVHHVHERGVIHRDLKPANVLLTADGTPKVNDFGLARRVEVGRGLTATGVVLGTPSYLAPEQASGHSKEVGAAADVWGLGAILYELLTGRPPFLGQTTFDTLQQVMNAEPVPVRRLQPKCPRDLETVCLKCLRKEPVNRYASAAELAEDLRRFQNGEPIAARPVGAAERGWRWCKRNPLPATLLAAVAVVLLSATSAVTALLVESNAQSLRAETEEGLRKQLESAAKRATELQHQAEEQEEWKQRFLMGAQLQRVAAVYESDPAQALALLYDENACPPALRDVAWRFYERACDRWNLATLVGHTAKVKATAFSPDGLTAATGDEEGVVRLWDALRGRPTATLKGHADAVLSVAYSPDGLTLASGSKDRTVRLWDVGTGESRATLTGHADWVHAVAYSPDGLTMASGSKDRTVRLWDAGTWQHRTLGGHAAPVKSVAFSPDGQTLAAGSGVWNGQGAPPGEVRLWDVKTGRLQDALPDARPPVAFSPDGLTLATAPRPDVLEPVWLWDVRTRQHKATVKGARVSTEGLAFSPDGLTLAAACWDGTVRLWDAATGQPRATLPGRVHSVTSLAYSPDGRALAAASGARGEPALLWDATTGQTRATLAGAGGHVAFSPDGLTLASGSGDGAVRLWDVRTGQARASLPGHSSPVVSLAFGREPRRERETLAGGYADGVVVLWDARTWESGDPIKGPPGAGYSVAFSPDGNTLASGSDEGVAKFWGVKTRQCRAAVPGGFGGVYAVAFSPDDRTFATGGADGVVRLWDVGPGRCRATLQGHAEAYSLAFSPDGRSLASASLNGSVWLWDVKTGQHRATLRGHTAAVYAVAYSPDGRAVLSGSLDGTVRLWDAETGELRATLDAHAGLMNAVAFGPGGRTVFGWDGNGKVFAWSLPDRERTDPVNAPLPIREAAVLLSPDGSLRAEVRGHGIVLIDTAAERRDREEQLAREPSNRAWWRLRQAERAEFAQNWFAAAFHLGELLKERPGDATLVRRHERALMNLRSVAEGPPEMEKLP